MTISTIRSGKGDCIHLRYISDRPYNIIIDTGSTATAGEYRKLCSSISSSGEAIDALFITHYDDDHIGGALKVTDVPYKAVYFNAYNGTEENENLSAAQNQRLFHLLPSSIICSSVLAGDVIEIGGAKIIIHAPDSCNLFPARQKMTEADVTLSSVSDWMFSLDELMERAYPAADASISNRASIVFTFELGSNRILFTGDTWPDLIPGGSYGMVKLPHHGSVRNIDEALLSRLFSSNFLICADGTRHPNKQTVAKLLKNYGTIKICSNYDWWMKGFLLQEDMKYINDHRLYFEIAKGINVNGEA